MNQKKIYVNPELYLLKLDTLDAFATSEDPSMEDVEWA